MKPEHFKLLSDKDWRLISMKLKTVEVNGKSYAEVDASGLPVYVHDDGKEIGFDAAQAVGKISALNGEAKSHREAKEAVEANLAKFSGIADPAKALEALEMMTKIDQKKLIDAGAVDQVKAEITKSFQAQLDEANGRSKTLESQLYDSMIGGSGTERTISAALYHVGSSLGLDMDTEAINELENAYWNPGGEFFDYETSDSVSALEVLQKIANAGKSYFLLSDGLASVAREGVKSWAGIISPQEMVEDLETAFVAPSADDYDGVDVTYINGTTWAEETVQCRTSDNPTPVKTEDYTLDGVLDKDRAYQIGMRRLMKYRQQRLTFTTTTELDALCYNVGDRVVLTDDIPGNQTVSSLIEDMVTADGVTTLTVTEPLDWTFPNPRALIRYQDGSASSLMVATRAGDCQLSVPYLAAFDDMLLSDSNIEPPRLIFCDSSRVGYAALISEIAPQSDGTCQVTAKEYRDSFYDYDNASYPGDVA